jgi:DNA polymerase-3 subunit delta'
MFETVTGQARVKEHFARAFREGTVAHAYLLAGREGLAKTAFARELGALLVTSCGGCGVCPECERARRGGHPDLHVVEREGDVIRVGQVDAILADLSLKPFAACRRVWLIPEAEYLRPEAANRLLKAMEEPPPDVHFLLVTDHLEGVLPTIVSRCRLVEFRPLGDEEIAVHLRDAHGLEEPERAALSCLAGGSIEQADRLAVDALGPRRRSRYLDHAAVVTAAGPAAPAAQQAFLTVLEEHWAEIKERVQAERERSLDELRSLFGKSDDYTLQAKAVEERVKREQRRLSRLAATDAVDILNSWVRDQWVVACGAGAVLCNRDRESESLDAAVAAPEHHARLLAAVARTRKDLSLNIDLKLAIKALFARFEEVAESA